MKNSPNSFPTLLKITKSWVSPPARPVSGWLVSEANVRKQLQTPFKDMPAFTGLPAKDINTLFPT